MGIQGGMMGGGMQPQWQQNPFYNPNQKWGQGGYSQMPQWNNSHNIYIPPIQFNMKCRKCKGTGVSKRRGMFVPCRRCYKKMGICPKCYGGGINYLKGKPCRRCQKGKWIKRMGRRSSSSSSNDNENWGQGQGFMGQGGFGGQGNFVGQGYGNQGFQQGPGFNQGGFGPAKW